MVHSTASFPTTPIARLTGHNGPVHAVAFSSGSGQYVLTGSQDRAVRLFNPANHTLIQTYEAHGYEVLDIAVAQDNRSFASVGGDKAAFLWDVETAQATRRFQGHTARIHTVAFGAADTVLVTGGFDGTLKVWDLKARTDSRPIMSFGEARDAVSHARVLGSEIFVGSVDGRVRVYDIESGYVDTDVVAPGVGVTSVAPTMAGDAYLASCLDSKLRFMDRRTGRCLQTLSSPKFTNEVYRIRATLAMGDAVALCGSEDGNVLAWDVLTGEVLHTLRHKEEATTAGAPTTKKDVVSAVAWNQLRRQWASAGGDGTVVVWGDGR